MKREEINEAYVKEEEIEKIVSKIKFLTFDKLRKHKHYEMSVVEKNTNEKELEEYFVKFDKIKLVLYRKRSGRSNNYDFHYVKEDGTFIIYSINIDKQPPILINAFHADKSFSNFMKVIEKKYGRRNH